MDKWVRRLHRLSLNQLKALRVLAESKSGIVTASNAARVTGLQGKSLGGVFSSLSRQKISDQYLIMPWGRGEGRGLRWKLNEKAIKTETLKTVINEILGDS